MLLYKNIFGILRDPGGIEVDEKGSKVHVIYGIWKITCFAWILEKLLSWRIWTTYRMLPTIPVFNQLTHVPDIVHTVLFLISLILLGFLFFRINRYLIIVLLIIEACSCLLDQNRIQPWEYQYFFTAVIFILYSKNQRIIISSIAFLFIATYFYSGISKLNGGFLQYIWSDLILGGFLRIPVYISHQKWLFYSGYFLGLFESMLGVGLLLKSTQKISAILLIIMHLVILIIFGPFGLSGYKILWFWNLSMIAALYLVFIANNEKLTIIQDLIKFWKRPVVLFWGILPAFSFIGLWQRNLSSNLFSGNVPRMVICIQDINRYPQLKRFSTRQDPSCVCKGMLRVNLQTWIFRETRVSINPEISLMLQMQQRLVQKYPNCGFSFVILNAGQGDIKQY